jgi:hypothetical protein
MEFRERKQKDGEMISEFIVNLKRLSIRCGYGDTLSENLRDTLTAGLKYLNIRKKLLSIKVLTWEKAQKEALLMETANKDAARGFQTPKQGEINRIKAQ